MRHFNSWQQFNNTMNQKIGAENNLIIILSIRPFKVESMVELELLLLESNIGFAHKNNKPESLVLCVNSYSTVV